MISFYCTILNLTLVQVRNMIEHMFPENESSIIECGTIFLSDGEVLECSVEPDSHSSGLYLTADYSGSFYEFEKVLHKLKSTIEKQSGIYDIECEIHDEGDQTTYSVRHPEYHDPIAQPAG